MATIKNISFVETAHTGKSARKPDKPKQKVVNTPSFFDNGGVRGVVIDDFKVPAKGSKDYERVPKVMKDLKISHGEVVTAVLRDFSEADMIIDQKHKNSGMGSINRRLEEIIEEADSKDIDFVNISLEDSYTPAEYQKNYGIDPKKITTEPEMLINIIRNKNQKNLQSFEYSILDSYVEYFDNVAELDKLGIPVYVSSGNEKNKINILTLPKEIHTIGALDESGQKAGYCSKTKLVDDYKPGTYKIKNDEGYGITLIEEKTAFDRLEDVRGTSFACPRAITNDINAEKSSLKIKNTCQN